MTTMLDEILELVRGNGPRVLPCKDKRSLIKDWPNKASNDPDQIRQWFTQYPDAQVAAVVPDNVLIFDIDIRNGGSQESLEAVTGPLPASLTTISGRGDGGKHVWVQHPGGEISARNLPQGVDLRKPGVHYVIIPPSLHNETSKPYQWAGLNIAELPTQAVEALRPPAKPDIPLPAATTRPCSSHGLVRTVTDAVEGERNNALLWAACRAFDNGDTEVIQDLFDAAMSNGLTETEVTATINSAERQERQAPTRTIAPIVGASVGTVHGDRHVFNSEHLDEVPPKPKTDAELLAGSEQTDTEEYDPLGQAFTATSLLAQKFPPLEYAVPGVITEGLGLIVAPPKIGKSWMVLDVGIACSQGGKAFNTITVDQRPVLYLALEDGPRRLQDRLHTLGLTTGNDDLTFMTDVPAGAMLTIGTFIERHAHRRPLVILDTLGKARDVFTGNDAYQKDYKELSDYKRLVDQHPGSTLLIVHHTNKGAHGDFVSSVSGTQGITGAADSVLTIERGRGDGEATLNVTSRDAAEGSYAMTFDKGTWTLDGTGLIDAAKNAQTRKATTGLGDAMTEVVELVAKHPEGISPKDVATLLHWEPSKARLYLKRAYDENRLAKASRGLYTPVTIDTPVTIPGIESPNSYTVTEVTPPTEGDHEYQN